LSAHFNSKKIDEKYLYVMRNVVGIYRSRIREKEKKKEEEKSIRKSLVSFLL